MSTRNQLVLAPPYPVEEALKRLGANLRTARLRRNQTIEAVAAKLGVGRHVVADAERGKPSTGIAIYAGLLWVFGLTEQLACLAEPSLDREGLILSKREGRLRARSAGKGVMDDDF